MPILTPEKPIVWLLPGNGQCPTDRNEITVRRAKEDHYLSLIRPAQAVLIVSGGEQRVPGPPRRDQDISSLQAQPVSYSSLNPILLVGRLGSRSDSE
jgi:hypothetical protein